MPIIYGVYGLLLIAWGITVSVTGGQLKVFKFETPPLAYLTPASGVVSLALALLSYIYPTPIGLVGAEIVGSLLAFLVGSFFFMRFRQLIDVQLRYGMAIETTNRQMQRYGSSRSYKVPHNNENHWITLTLSALSGAVGILSLVTLGAHL